MGIVDGDTGFSAHGTHVTGTISANGSGNSEAKGMAPNVNVKSYNWTNDEAEMVVAANDATTPILLSNHSYGVPINQGEDELLDSWFMGAYTQDARDIDNISKNNPKYLIVTSAGNSGNTAYDGGLFAGFDKLTTDKNAKNRWTGSTAGFLLLFANEADLFIASCAFMVYCSKFINLSLICFYFIDEIVIK
jgi:hypothetical protein